MGFLNTIFGGSQRPLSDRKEPVLPDMMAQSLENPSTPLSEIGGWGEFLGLPGTGDDWMPPVSERTAMACSAVYRCVTLEAGVIAGLPLKIYRLSTDGQREELPNHRLMPLLQTAPFPGRALTAFSWRELWGVNMLLWGNHYSAIRYDGAGRVIGFDAYMPWQVQVVRLPGKRGINFYVCTDDDGNSEALHQEDMLHIPGPGFDGIKGLSRIQSFARGSVGLSRSMEERTGRVHQNASMPSGVMQVPGKMSDPAFKRLRRQLEEAHTGVANWGKTVIADEGSKYTPFQLSPQDLQTIEARRYQVADISRFFGVPLHLLNETDKTTSWGTGLSENTLAYLIFSLDADLRRIESELNYKLFSGTRLFAEFDRDGLLSMDPAKTASVMQSEISSGVSTINEARRKKNRPPVKGGDTPLINSTNVPLTTQAAKGPDNASPVPQPLPRQQE